MQGSEALHRDTAEHPFLLTVPQGHCRLEPLHHLTIKEAGIWPRADDVVEYCSLLRSKIGIIIKLLSSLSHLGDL